MDRLNTIFAGDLLPKWDFWCTWTPSAAEICPSSLAKYFTDHNYAVERCELRHYVKCEQNLNIPKIMKFSSDNGKSKKSSLEDGRMKTALVKDLMEFIGMVTLSCNFVDEEGYLSSYDMLSDSEIVGRAHVGIWKRMFSTKQIVDLVTQLRLVMILLIFYEKMFKFI